MADKLNDVKLRVFESLQDDVHKGIARLDPQIMRNLELVRGDYISIKGGRETIAIVDRAYPADVGENILRIDGLIRKNAKVSVGEQVIVKKASVRAATRIMLSPTQQGIAFPPNQEDAVRHALLGRPVAKDDKIFLSAIYRRNNLPDGFPDMFGDLNDLFGMGMGFGTPTQHVKFKVTSTTPGTFVFIDENTEIVLSNKMVDDSEDGTSKPEIAYEDIGGVTEEIKKIREMVELPLKHPEIFEKLGIEAPKGVLLHGPPGTGKTLLAKAVASESDANFILLNGPEVMSKFYGESEKKIRDIFEEAEKNAPSIIFFDELDAIAPKREEVQGEVERRVVSQLLTMMDGLKARGKVVVIGATNRVNSVDPALRRPGRFDREIEISVPNKFGRLDILKIHTRNMPLRAPMRKNYIVNKITSLRNSLKDMTASAKQSMSDDKKLDELQKDMKATKERLDFLEPFANILGDVEVKNESAFKKLSTKEREELNRVLLEGMMEEIASKTHGFVGADLAALTKEAAMNVLRKMLPKLRLEENEPIPKEVLDTAVIRQEDFDDALKVVRPSAMREVFVENPNVHWEDVGGMENTKQELKEAVEWPIKNPGAFKKLGIRAPRGILLYGPPGTGKTLLAKAVATESESNFIQIKGPSLLSMWVGKSEEGVRKVFERARQVAPCVIFFDEIDAMAGKRGVEAGTKVTERVLNQLLAEMDGLDSLKDVTVIGATNRPDMLDSALLRPGRFDRIILADVPDEQSRQKIFQVHLRNTPLSKDVDVPELVKLTDGFVGADIEALVREAALHALRENINAAVVGKMDFDEALKKVKPSVSKETATRYRKIEEIYIKKARAGIETPGPLYTG